MNYDIDKIRVACLELMGWRVTNRYQPPRWWRQGDPPETNLRTIDQIPNPTKSLDHALPLMEKYKITLAPPRIVLRHKKLVSLWTAESSGTVAEHEDAMVAVCLCALRIKHHDLKDFEIAPKKNARKR